MSTATKRSDRETESRASAERDDYYSSTLDALPTPPAKDGEVLKAGQFLHFLVRHRPAEIEPSQVLQSCQFFQPGVGYRRGTQVEVLESSQVPQT